jgi:hypothetical protein
LNYSFQSSRLLHALPSRLLTTFGAFAFMIKNTLFALYEFLTRSLWVFRCDSDLTTVKVTNADWPPIWIGATLFAREEPDFGPERILL